MSHYRRFIYQVITDTRTEPTNSPGKALAIATMLKDSGQRVKITMNGNLIYDSDRAVRMPKLAG